MQSARPSAEFDMPALRKALRTDAGGAALAQLWVEGVKQKRLARLLGYDTAYTINYAIGCFIARYHPTAYRGRGTAAGALKHYLAGRQPYWWEAKHNG